MNDLQCSMGDVLSDEVQENHYLYFTKLSCVQVLVFFKYKCVRSISFITADFAVLSSCFYSAYVLPSDNKLINMKNNKNKLQLQKKQRHGTGADDSSPEQLHCKQLNINKQSIISPSWYHKHSYHNHSVYIPLHSHNAIMNFQTAAFCCFLSYMQHGSCMLCYQYRSFMSHPMVKQEPSFP